MHQNAADRVRGVLSAFVPWLDRNRASRFLRLGDLQDSERNRRSTHVAKAAYRSRNALAHAGSAAQEVTKFVVASTIALC